MIPGYDYLFSWYKYLFCQDELDTVKPLDARERIIFEDYLLQKDMQELRDIFAFVRKKENSLKQKICR